MEVGGSARGSAFRSALKVNTVPGTSARPPLPLVPSKKLTPGCVLPASKATGCWRAVIVIVTHPKKAGGEPAGGVTWLLQANSKRLDSSAVELVLKVFNG